MTPIQPGTIKQLQSCGARFADYGCSAGANSAATLRAVIDRMQDSGMHSNLYKTFVGEIESVRLAEVYPSYRGSFYLVDEKLSVL